MGLIIGSRICDKGCGSGTAQPDLHGAKGGDAFGAAVWRSWTSTFAGDLITFDYVRPQDGIGLTVRTSWTA